jgi:hypothetical protein
MNGMAIDQLIAMERQRAYDQGRDAATMLPESSYGATQSRVVTFGFTSFKALRDQIRMHQGRREGCELAGQVYMWSCKLIHIHHGDYEKCAILICSTHWDI